MKRMTRALLVLSAAICILLAACGGSGDPVATLQEEVLAVHDEVMPKMGDISRLERAFRKEREELVQSAQPDTTRIRLLGEHVDALQFANQSMMDWMHTFEAPPAGLPQEEALAHLRKELESIERVRQQMLESLENAQTLSKTP